MKRRFPATLRWLLERLISGRHAVELAGDLEEQFRSGRSRSWLWRQAFAAIAVAVVNGLRRHPVLVTASCVTGWAVVLGFFTVVGGPLAALDRRLLAEDLLVPYSFLWWGRSILMWVVVGSPFLVGGWLAARIAWSCPMPSVLAFAGSVSAAITGALLLDGQGNATAAEILSIRIWVPLFLILAPPLVIVAGGLLATSGYRADRGQTSTS
jgi:hypothetical protein